MRGGKPEFNWTNYSDAIDEVDRQASVCLALGCRFTAKPQDMKKICDALRVAQSAKLNYDAVRRRIERREVSLASGLFRAMCIAAVINAIATLAGLT